MDDHHQEVIAYCRENNYHGLIADDAEYVVFDAPRYFSSEQLKLTYKVCSFISVSMFPKNFFNLYILIEILICRGLSILKNILLMKF